MCNCSQILKSLPVCIIVSNGQDSTVTILVSSMLWLGRVSGNILDDINQALFFLQHLKEFPNISDYTMICDLENPCAIPLRCCLCGAICCLLCVTCSKVELESLVANVEHSFDIYQCRCLHSLQVDHLHLHYRRYEDDLLTLQNLRSHHLVVEMQLHSAFSDLRQILCPCCIAVAGQTPGFSSRS